MSGRSMLSLALGLAVLAGAMAAPVPALGREVRVQMKVIIPGLEILLQDSASVPQPAATAARSSLPAIPGGAGVDKAMEVRTEELRRAFDRMVAEAGPFVVCVKVTKGRAEGQLE